MQPKYQYITHLDTFVSSTSTSEVLERYCLLSYPFQAQQKSYEVKTMRSSPEHLQSLYPINSFITKRFVGTQGKKLWYEDGFNRKLNNDNFYIS